MASLTHQEYAAEDIKTYNIIRKQTQIEIVSHEGIEFEIHPNVFSPKYFTDSYWFGVEISNLVKNQKFLEIGTGTGIIALFAALKGASVTATDINPAAVNNCQANFSKHKIKGKVILSDLFDSLPEDEKFDFIFWNHPFFEAEEEVNDILLKAGFDHSYQSLERYLRQAHQFLSPKGKLLLGTGNAANLDRIFDICKNLSLKYSLLKEIEMPVNPGSNIMNDYRIYHFFKS